MAKHTIDINLNSNSSKGGGGGASKSSNFDNLIKELIKEIKKLSAPTGKGGTSKLALDDNA